VVVTRSGGSSAATDRGIAQSHAHAPRSPWSSNPLCSPRGDSKNFREIFVAAAAAADGIAGVGLAGPAAAAPGGANIPGVYTQNSPSGAESANGNGNGKAVGRPAAGSVGNADTKNPPGQQPNGSDANNGYECDGNNGIAKGNPAHTGCGGGD